MARFARQVTPALVQFWRVLMASKGLIGAVALAATVLTLIVVFRMTPIYRATSVVLVESSKNKVVSIEEMYSGISGNREYFQTQAEFLRSRDVSLRVIRDLKLADHPQFDPSQHKGFKIGAWISALLGTTSPPDLSEQAAENTILGEFQNRLSVAPIRASQLIQVSFESPDPKLAALVANSISESYIRAELDARFKMTQTANVWLNERLGVLREKLDQSEKDLQQYRDEAGLVEKSSAQSPSTRQLDEVQQRLIQARITRSQAEQVYNQVRSTSPDRYQVPTVFNNPSVARARELEAAAESKLAEMAQRFGAAHPMYQSANNEAEAARAYTKRQGDAVIASLSKEFEVARATERALEESLGKSRGSIQELNRKEVKLGALEREAASNRQLYQTFLARVKETNATGDFQTPIARLVDSARVPVYAEKPPKFQLAIIGALGGLLLGIAVAAIKERLGNVVRSTEEVDTKLNAALLAAVPALTKEQALRAGAMQIEAPDSAFAESVRTILTGIQLSTISQASSVIGFTSTLAGEGKSTLAINFALEQARTKKVLLIDLDLRRPTTAIKLGMPAGAPGIAELLTGKCGVEQVIRVVSGSSLSVMSGGNAVQNPMDLLLSPHFEQAIRSLQAIFDVIVIDTPPLQLVSDALLIGRTCTGLVYVVRSALTAVPMIRANLERLSKADITVFGVVLNVHDFKRAEQYYGEYTSYSTSGYGAANTKL